MIIRQATADEMLSLWEYEDYDDASLNGKFFYKNIASKKAEFWTIEEDGRLIGELYPFFDMEDSDFASGKDTAYLCAFRIEEKFRGQGLGTRLITAVMEDLKKRGFHGVTIGVDENEEQNLRLYMRLGFTQKIKDCYEDPCDVNKEMKPRKCKPFLLLYKEL